ncbi:MAG: hypothetical protein H0U98_05710 [Alphaproteobacteria bacterium]|nr:hypothetical protein [Alphaproteobacteria bacterium]
MRTIAAFVFLLATAGGARAADCPLTILGSMDLQVSPDNLQVPLTFGTVEKSFYLEIGSGLNMITQEAADQAGFHFHSLDPNIRLGGYGQNITRLGNSPKFRMGTLPGDDVEFGILPRHWRTPPSPAIWAIACSSSWTSNSTSPSTS